MKIREIHFNHDPENGPTVTLSRSIEDSYDDRQEVIRAPEWSDGISQPVVYARGAVKGPVTIKVKFGKGPKNERVTIRAVAPDEARIRPTGPVRAITSIGEVHERVVAFDDNGESALETFELTGRLERGPVDQVTVDWIWQTRVDPERWINFGKTRILIYLILAKPRPALNNVNILRLKLVALATEWANGATTVDAIIANIARAINQHQALIYNSSAKQFTTTDVFYFMNFEKDIRKAASINIDCDGIASALVALANCLGASLQPLVLEPTFATQLIQPLNASWFSTSWGHHEIAVDSGSPVCDASGMVMPGAKMIDGQSLPNREGEQLIVFDANLHLNKPAPIFPIKIKLGTAGNGNGDYLDLLVALPGSAPSATPYPPRKLF